MSLPALRLERGVPLALPPLVRASDGAPPARATRVTLLDDGEQLHVDFDCDDPDPWATLAQRDGPLWQEEVVEVFLAPGRATPNRYFEFELNPLGTLFDARVECPNGDRRGLAVDSGWDCAGLAARVAIDRPAARWRAGLAIPWRGLAAGARVAEWRLNVYRVERPRPGDAEYSAWSPTRVAPADFHRPARFGYLTRAGIG